MTLDGVTALVFTALVVAVSGVVYIVDTVTRRDEGAGRVWAQAFLAGILTTLTYLLWSLQPADWWMVAVGNAAFVAATAFMWLGCLVFNGRRMRVPALVAAIAVVGAALAALAEGPVAGGWSGAIWMFAALLILAGLGAAECTRGAMSKLPTSWALGAVLGIQSLWFVARISVFVAVGPFDPLFLSWFGSTPMSFLTIALTIVALVVATSLRSSGPRVRPAPRADGQPWLDDILPHAVFHRMLTMLLDRAREGDELVAVVVVRVEDLAQIATAFGGEVSRTVTDTWRDGVSRYSPALAIVGEDGPLCVAVAVVADDPPAARRAGLRIYRGLFAELTALTDGVVPVVGVGVGLTATTGYDADLLLTTAREAARRATLAVEDSVFMGESG